MADWVLDASAALALLLDEPGADRAWQALNLGIEVQLIR
jgi:PIN domain nuclease of toxin-antitoxin system